MLHCSAQLLFNGLGCCSLQLPPLQAPRCLLSFAEPVLNVSWKVDSELMALSGHSSTAEALDNIERGTPLLWSSSNANRWPDSLKAKVSLYLAVRLCRWATCPIAPGLLAAQWPQCAHASVGPLTHVSVSFAGTQAYAMLAKFS